MKHTKKVGIPAFSGYDDCRCTIIRFCGMEDGFVIPGQNSGSNSYDDLFWDTTNRNDSTIISSSTTEDKKEKRIQQKKEDTGSKKIR